MWFHEMDTENDWDSDQSGLGKPSRVEHRMTSVPGHVKMKESEVKRSLRGRKVLGTGDDAINSNDTSLTD